MSRVWEDALVQHQVPIGPGFEREPAREPPERAFLPPHRRTEIIP
jgi:hypothetical protein